MVRTKKISYPYRENAKWIIFGGSLTMFSGLLLSLINNLSAWGFSNFGMIAGGIFIGIGVVLYYIQIENVSHEIL